MITIEKQTGGAILAITENGLPVMKQGFQFDKDDLEGLKIMLQTLSNYLVKPDDQYERV